MDAKAQAISEYLASGIPSSTVEHAYLGTNDVHLFRVKRNGNIYPVRFSREVFEDSTEECLRDLLRSNLVCSQIYDQTWPSDTVFTNTGLVRMPD